MNDRNQEVGTISLIIGGVLFLGVILLLAAAILGWLFYRHSSEEMIKANQAAGDARRAQVQEIENEAASQTESVEQKEVHETVPD